MAVVQFRYSDIYDMSLAKWFNSTWRSKNKLCGKRYVLHLQEEWRIYEDSVLQNLKQFGFTLPSDIIAYVVTAWPGVIAFSDPLTIPIYKDRRQALVKTIHEFAHVVLSYKENYPLKVKVLAGIKSAFSKESYATQLHVAVNLFQEQIMNNIPELYEFLVDEKQVSENNYPGQKKAWSILEKIKGESKVQNPVQFLADLVPI